MNRVRPKLVAITGGSGSGKSWLAERLQQLLGEDAQRLSLDAFYRDRSHLSPGRRACINYDHPRCIEWTAVAAVLAQLKQGRTVRIPRYDFATHTRLPTEDSFVPRPVVLVEGLWLLRQPAIRRLFDLTMFLDSSEQLRFEWRLGRDTAERARNVQDVKEQFRATVAPMHRRFVDPQKRNADLVLKQPLDLKAVDKLFDHLWRLLASDAIHPRRQSDALRAKARALIRGRDL